LAALENAREIGQDRTRARRSTVRALLPHHDKVDSENSAARLQQGDGRDGAALPDDYEVQVAMLSRCSFSLEDRPQLCEPAPIGRILEKLFEQNPQHPGVSHFIIHAYDFAAARGPRDCGSQALCEHRAAVPHARHMPSHIYSMVGMWEESIASNASALEIQPDYYHAADFSVYAHLQLAQDSKAKALIEKALRPRPVATVQVALATSWPRRAMETRYLLDEAIGKARRRCR